MTLQSIVLERFFGPERPPGHPFGVVRVPKIDVTAPAAPGGPHPGPGFDARHAAAGTASAVATDVGASAARVPAMESKARGTRMPDAPGAMP